MQPQREPRGARGATALTHDLRYLLNSATKAEIRRARVEDDHAHLTIDVDGCALTVATDQLTLVKGDIERLTARTSRRHNLYKGIKHPERLTIEELKERNLPLYWNEEWLRSEIARLGSYAAIGREHGYRSATIASYALRKFGINFKMGRDQKKAALLKDASTKRYTREQLARKHRVGIATVYRWLASAKKPTRNRAADKRAA